MKLENQVAIVTGSAHGIGRETAYEFVRQGARVVIADRLAGEAEQVVHHIRHELNGEAIAVPMDQTDVDQVQELVDRTVAAFGEINILFANAGFARMVPFLEITPKQWQAMVNVNLNGTFYVCQAVARQMVSQGQGGSMVVTASIFSDFVANQLVHYSAAKAGVKMLAKCLASELGNYRIRVNTVLPGVIETEMTTSLVEDPKIAHMLRATIPAGRWGQPEELAKVVTFLASEEASFVNGQQITICGGQSLPMVPPWRPLDYTETNTIDWETPLQRFPFTD